MSDENTPKLRLRPKLAGAASATPPPAPANPPPVSPEVEQSEESAAEPLAVWPEAKPAALRPKLSLKADEAASADEAAGPGKNVPVNESASASVPPSAPVKPVLTPRVKPTLSLAPEEKKGSDDSGATPPFAVPPAGERKLPAVLNAPPPPKIKVAIPTTETWPAVLDAPPPAGLSPVPLSPKDGSAEAEPAEIAAIRKASTFPFPSPTAKFPPLPGLSAAGGTEPSETAAPGGFLKKLLVIGVPVFLLLAGGAAFAYFKFFAKPAAKPSAAPAPVAVKVQPAPPPAAPASAAKQMIDKMQQEQLAPLNEVVAAEPAPAQPAPSAALPEPAPAQTTEPAATSPIAAEPVVAPPPAPVQPPPPPPPPSLAFKAWVINLKIRGVRGGEAQRVFIDKTSYVPGDVVNQQLGIMFTGFDEATRMLTFKDKTGATFARRD